VNVAIATSFSCGLSFWLRLQAEGCKVLVWNQDKEQQQVGTGLVPTCSTWAKLLDWAKQGALANQPTVVLFDSSGMGEQADEARRWGLLVVGGGKFCDKLEKDRSYGFEIAKNCGATLPSYVDFKSFQEARQWAQKLPQEESVYWKSDRFLESDATKSATGGQQLSEYLDSVIRRFGPRGECMVQQKIDGVPLSTARWWNGRAFVGPYEGTIEHKKCWNDDIGPATGCAFNAVWFYADEPDIALKLGFSNLTQVFLREQAPPGIYDMNAIAGEDGEAYFLEWTPRFGYDSEPTSLCLWESASQLLYALATGTDLPEWSNQTAFSLRLTIPPYPWEHGKREMKHTSLDVEVRGIKVDDLIGGDFLPYELAFDSVKGLHVASPEGIVGLAIHIGDSLSELNSSALDTAKKIDAPGLQYRTDAADCILKDGDSMLASGFWCPPGLLE
jgi:phosphoribosylamine--glycine ligase